MRKSKSSKEAENLKLLQEIMVLCVTISVSECNPVHIFFNYSGHVNETHIYGYTKGFGKTPDWDINCRFYVEDKSLHSKLLKTKQYLLKIQSEFAHTKPFVLNDSIF